MKRLSDKVLKWVSILHIISMSVWALNIVLVAAFDFSPIPMWISLVVMNVFYAIRECNRRP